MPGNDSKETEKRKASPRLEGIAVMCNLGEVRRFEDLRGRKGNLGIVQPIDRELCVRGSCLVQGLMHKVVKAIVGSTGLNFSETEKYSR
jgi:hypothetical protein